MTGLGGAARHPREDGERQRRQVVAEPTGTAGTGVAGGERAAPYPIRLLSNIAQAEKVTAFLFSEEAFDDRRFTPGEEEQLRLLPVRALAGELTMWVAEDERKEIAGICCLTENEQKSGGYSWDYIVVRRNCRNTGLASAFIREMIRCAAEASARYIITYTCSLPEYGPIRRLFDRNGFRLVGCCPDYYFEGEDRLIYCLNPVRC